jgi:hypothetical protein
LSALLCGRNDSALRSRCGLLRNGHVGSLSWRILQHTCMRMKVQALTNNNQRSLRGGNAGGISGFIAGRRGRLNHNKSNRRAKGEKETGQRPRNAARLGQVALRVKKLNRAC